MSARARRPLSRVLNGFTLGTLLVSCVALVGAFRFEEPLFGAFCLGISAACLAAGILILSYGVFVRGTEAALVADLGPARPGVAESLADIGARVRRRVSMDLTVARESGRRLRGSLRVRNHTGRDVAVGEIAVARPDKARVAVAPGVGPGDPTPVTVEFTSGAAELGAALAPDAAVAIEFFILLPDGAFGGRRLDIEVAFSAASGSLERRTLRQRIPG